MFDNVLYQPASEMLIKDISGGTLPNAVLFSGPDSSGKLTCALELARVLSCRAPGKEKGHWLCTCPSCLRHKALNTPDVIIAGPGDCTPEIKASGETLLNASATNASWAKAAVYLFIRSVRKLTLRFSPVLWEGDDKASKAAPFLSTIEELLEEINPLEDLPEPEKLKKTVEAVIKQCSGLESSLMYDTVPVNQIRRAATWARMTSPESKKCIILENADKMQDSVRNALLKILEEPPEDAIFVLTTARRGAIIPTILSRVRTYTFVERTAVQQAEIVSRVFHSENGNGGSEASVNGFLSSFLPVSYDEIKKEAVAFCNSLLTGKRLNLDEMVKNLNGFEPRVILKLFFEFVLDYLGHFLREDVDSEKLASRTEKSAEILEAIRTTYDNITIYNQSVVSALEALYERIL
ncbi:MAG: DNA polymerase III [Spirochaetaceae bacterium]|nr:DNA polymerase III [Spirochaetaceae bacterium]